LGRGTALGEVAEWLKAAVSKTVMGHWPIESSNLSLSAKTRRVGRRIAKQMDASRFLIAGGLTVWLGGLVAAAGYVGWRMRFPRSLFRSGYESMPVAGRVLSGLVGLAIFAGTAFTYPTVAWVFTVFASGLVIYVLAAYAVALTVERRRARRLGLPEPGTDATVSFAESAVFLAIALPFAVAALVLTVYGTANEFGGNGGEGGAALGLGAVAWFLAIVMGLYASPLLLVRRRR
jgi:hypothetical protein